MKRTLRLLSLLLALLLCCAAFLTACTNPDGKDTSTEAQASESKAPKDSYKLRFTSYTNGTCSVTGIEVSEDAENLTLVIPEFSPDGQKVTFYNTDELSFTNVPRLILEEDFIAHIDEPLRQAVENREIPEYRYNQIVNVFFDKKSLESQETDADKEWMLQKYPITAVSNVYECYFSAFDAEDLALVSRYLSQIDYTSVKCFADAQKLVALARQNGIDSYSVDDLAINSAAIVSISLPDSLESICPYAFFGCHAVKGNVLESIVYFGNEENPYLLLQRAENEEITSVVMPESTKFVGDHAFYGCTDLETVSIADGVKALGNSVFRDCDSLRSIVIPGSVKTVGDSVFMESDRLESVVISEGVTRLGDDVFLSCDGLTSVVVPKSMMRMGKSVFGFCPDLKNIYYAGSAADWAKIRITSDEYETEALPLYYYSETQPTEAGNYWRYVDGVPTAW